MKTYSAKPADISRKWHVIDASQNSIGRIATVVARLLTGKHKPSFTNHIDCGDYVIVINTDNLKTSGHKIDQKIYYRHSEFPGNLKQTTLSEKTIKNSTTVIESAVSGMLPKNKLKPERLKRLKIYKGSEHDHHAQKPEVFSVGKEG